PDSLRSRGGSRVAGRDRRTGSSAPLARDGSNRQVPAGARGSAGRSPDLADDARGGSGAAGRRTPPPRSGRLERPLNVVPTLLWGFSWRTFVYVVVYGVCQVAFTLVAWKSLAGHRHARPFSPLDEVYSSPFTPPVSIILPAYNEEAGVVASVHSLLDLRYPRHEVIVVNDGSK